MKDMNNQEAIEMMNRCMSEIVGLRSTIERLKPKAEAYDNLATVLRLLPQPSQGASEDLVWRMKNRIAELTPPVPTPAPVPM